MTSLREERLQERVAEIRPQLAKAREVAEKADAEGRDMTAEEKAIYDPIVAKAREVADALKAHRHDQEVWEFARELGAEVIGGLGGGALSSSGSPSKSRRLFFKGMGAKVATQMLGADNTKALAPSGAAVAGHDFQADPIALGQVATGLLDVLPVTQHTTAEYAYLRHTTRTNNAAVVAEGATKPTSAYSVTRVEQSLAVVAHLSEGIPRFWLLDSTALASSFPASRVSSSPGPRPSHCARAV